METIGDSVTDVTLCQWRSPPPSFPATTPVSLLAVMRDACETRQTGQLEIRAGRLWGEMELWDTSPIILDTTDFVWNSSCKLYNAVKKFEYLVFPCFI